MGILSLNVLRCSFPKCKYTKLNIFIAISCRTIQAQCTTLTFIYPLNSNNVAFINPFFTPLIDSHSEDNLCYTWGQSHYKTFDGKYFYFPGRCSYKLVADCLDDLFSIHVTNDDGCLSITNCRRSVELYLGENEIKVHLQLLDLSSRNWSNYLCFEQPFIVKSKAGVPLGDFFRAKRFFQKTCTFSSKSLSGKRLKVFMKRKLSFRYLNELLK